MSNPLMQMTNLGQSPWHDNIRRDLLTSGKLKRMVEDGAITGLTSNPTIFEQAIAGTKDYDADLERLARQGKNAEEIFYALAIEDIQNAADVFRPVWNRTNGADGYVSIEVSPKLANETEATAKEAKRLWNVVDRPNLMVKIPATREGVPAIQRSIADGLNINVTLIFSLERYEEVMDAYLNGLLERHRAGKPLGHIASVASFFVSRVDSAVDKLIDEKLTIVPDADRPKLLALKGKAAIANAKLAYENFRKKFATEGAQALQNAGARKQRPLWASTSTKNPAYPDTYYVDALLGPDTVDTMPPATIDAYLDHGVPRVTLDQNLDEARRVMEELAVAGISMAAVTKKLEEDGVASFAKSFDSLLAVVEQRRAAVVATSAPAPKAAKAAKPAKRSKTKAAKSVKASGAKRTAKKRGATAKTRARKAKTVRAKAPKGKPSGSKGRHGRSTAKKPVGGARKKAGKGRGMKSRGKAGATAKLGKRASRKGR